MRPRKRQPANAPANAGAKKKANFRHPRAGGGNPLAPQIKKGHGGVARVRPPRAPAPAAASPRLEHRKGAIHDGGHSADMAGGRKKPARSTAPKSTVRGSRHASTKAPANAPVWLYGRHAVLAALANPARRCRRWLTTTAALEGVSLAGPPSQGGVSQRWALSPELIERTRIEALLPAHAVHQGMALLAEPLPAADFEAVCEAQSQSRSRVIVLDQVEDPQNVGAILRSAAAFEALAVILTDRNAAPVSGALAKAASGALEIVPLCRVPNLGRALDRLAELGYWRVGLDAAGEKPLAEVLPGIRHVALVLGAEGAGLRRLTAEKCDYLAKLPISSAMESLNVSAAAAIALYEAARG